METKKTNPIENLDGRPASQGLTLLKKHFSGERLTARQALIANCCECMGYYVDGREDCAMPDCPCYRFYPYRADRKRGPITKHEPKPELADATHLD